MRATLGVSIPGGRLHPSLHPRDSSRGLIGGVWHGLPPPPTMTRILPLQLPHCTIRLSEEATWACHLPSTSCTAPFSIHCWMRVFAPRLGCGVLFCYFSTLGLCRMVKRAGGGTDVGSGVQRRQRDWRTAIRSAQRSPAAACSARCMRGGRTSEQYSFIRANPS